MVYLFKIPNKYKERKLPPEIYRELRKVGRICAECKSKDIKGMAQGKVLCHKCLANTMENRKNGK